MLGVSNTTVCGVRDQAGVLGDSLQRAGLTVTTLWLERDEGAGLLTDLATARRWLREVGETLQRQRPDWVLCHYSVFAWGRRGLPVLTPLVSIALARTGAPLVAVLHEFAYPFRTRGWRGTVLAITQRAVLVPLLWPCQAVVVTTDERRRWLLSRPWLPRRPAARVAVTSNLPPPSARPHGDGDRGAGAVTVGVVGYGSEGVAPEPVVAAVARLVDEGLAVRLSLIGAPGPGSRPARAWEEAARSHGAGPALSMTGVLDAPELAGAIRDADVVVLPDPLGPTSRKSTLAAVLGLGKAVVSLDGPQRWDTVAEECAVVLASSGEELARAVRGLVVDGDLRAGQEKRAAEFYRRHLAPDVVAGRMADFLASVDAGPAAARRVRR